VLVVTLYIAFIYLHIGSASYYDDSSTIPRSTKRLARTNNTTLVDTTRQYISWLTLCKLLVVLILTGLDRRALQYKEHASVNSVNRSTSAHTAAAKAYTTLHFEVLYGNKQLMPYE
jgi:hypothetical protein